ncbi:MAG: recombinase [Neisseria sp.]|nr:recombinase [Neisseria sp.]
MKKKNIRPETLGADLAQLLAADCFVETLNGLVQFLRKGGVKTASARFDLLLDTLAADEELAARLGNRFHAWLGEVYIYPALVGLGIFSRSGFTREMGIRLYERFFPSFKDFNNLRDVFLYLFYQRKDEAWLQTLSLRQWLSLHQILCAHTEAARLQSTARQLTQARLHAIEMLSVWVAAEELEPEFIRLEPRLLSVESAFVGLHHEIIRVVAHYRESSEPYDTAHIEVMIAQCRALVERLRRRGTGAGAGSSVKVAHLLERLSQSLDRIQVLLDIQTASDESERNRHTVSLLTSMTTAALEQHSTGLLRRRSIKMLARSISENTGDHGEHYITRSKSEYWSMLRSAAGGGVIIALLALNKLHIATYGFGDFTTSLLNGLNYGLGFMLIHMLHFTVATKQPAMTAAKIAEKIGEGEQGRAKYTRVAQLLIDVIRSQSVAVFGNVSVAMLVAVGVALFYTQQSGQAILSANETAYQVKSMQPFSQPTLWYAAIAGVWLFCSGIIAGFFDNRADYLNLRKRLPVQPLLQKILPHKARMWLGEYLHNNYGSLMGNFIFGMLLGMTGWLGHLLNLPLDIRHVAFSSANLGYAAASSDMAWWSFLYNLWGVLLIGGVNLWVSFGLALYVALRSRGTRIESLPALSAAFVRELKTKPLSLLFPVGLAKNEKESDKTAAEKNGK